MLLAPKTYLKSHHVINEYYYFFFDDFNVVVLFAIKYSPGVFLCGCNPKLKA